MMYSTTILVVSFVNIQRTIPSQATSPDGLNLEINDGGSWFIIKKNEVRMMDIDTLDVEL